MLNSVILIGRLTRDPEVRYTQDQMAIAKFSIAVDRIPKRDGTKEADFPRITVFGKQAENCDRYLKKGRLVAIQGRLQTGSYQNKDGATVYTTDVIANSVQFLEWGDRNQQGGQGYQGEQQFQQPQEPRQGQPQAPAGQGEPAPDMGVPDGFQALDDDDIPF